MRNTIVANSHLLTLLSSYKASEEAPWASLGAFKASCAYPQVW